MLYKTIVLELITQRPELHHRLRASRTLLTTLNSYADAMKIRHEFWKTQLLLAKPATNPQLAASQALEIALKELDSLLTESPLSEDEPVSRDAMIVIEHPFPIA